MFKVYLVEAGIKGFINEKLERNSMAAAQEIYFAKVFMVRFF